MHGLCREEKEDSDEEEEEEEEEKQEPEEDFKVSRCENQISISIDKMVCVIYYGVNQKRPTHLYVHASPALAHTALHTPCADYLFPLRAMPAFPLMGRRPPCVPRTASASLLTPPFISVSEWQLPMLMLRVTRAVSTEEGEQGGSGGGGHGRRRTIASGVNRPQRWRLEVLPLLTPRVGYVRPCMDCR